MTVSRVINASAAVRAGRTRAGQAGSQGARLRSKPIGTRAECSAPRGNRGAGSRTSRTPASLRSSTRSRKIADGGPDGAARQVDERPEREADFLQTVASLRVDGAIIGAAGDTAAASLKQLGSAGIPVVAIDRRVDKLDLDIVLGAITEPAELLTQHLIEHGHQRIGMIRGPSMASTSRRASRWLPPCVEGRADRGGPRSTASRGSGKTTASGSARSTQRAKSSHRSAHR